MKALSSIILRPQQNLILVGGLLKGLTGFPSGYKEDLLVKGSISLFPSMKAVGYLGQPGSLAGVMVDGALNWLNWEEHKKPQLIYNSDLIPDYTLSGFFVIRPSAEGHLIFGVSDLKNVNVDTLVIGDVRIEEQKMYFHSKLSGLDGDGLILEGGLNPENYHPCRNPFDFIILNGIDSERYDDFYLAIEVPSLHEVCFNRVDCERFLERGNSLLEFASKCPNQIFIEEDGGEIEIWVSKKNPAINNSEVFQKFLKDYKEAFSKI